MAVKAFHLNAEGEWVKSYKRLPMPKRDAKLSHRATEEMRVVEASVGKLDAILPAPILQKKLGKTTYRVWATLLGMRNEKGESHPSMAGLARACYTSVHQLEKSLARLRQFKLVENLGFLWQPVPCNCKVDYCHDHKIFMRYVYGALRFTEDRISQIALVPRETAAIAKAAAGQGGARKGAGRPKGAKDTAPRREPTKTIKGGAGKSNVGAYKYQIPFYQKNLTVLLQKERGFTPRSFSLTKAEENTMPTPSQPTLPASSAPALADPAPALSGQTGSQATGSPMPSAPIATKASSSPSKPPSQPGLAQHAPRPSGRVCVAATAPAAEAVIHPVPDDLEGDGADEGVDILELYGFEETPLGIQLKGGRSKAPVQRYTADDMGAASMLANQVAVLRAPSPARIKPELGEEERLRLLNTAFRAAHERVHKQDFYRRGGIKLTDKQRKQMLEASEALMAEVLSPLSWALFSLYQWRRMGKKTLPSLSWIWSSQRIHEHAKWCHEEVGSQHSARPYYQPATTELMQRLGRLRAALGYGRPTGEVVSEIIPEALRDRLLAEQEQQNKRGMALLEAAISNGEWVW